MQEKTVNHTISSVDFQRAARLGAVIGYHNYAQTGIYDALDRVRAVCPVGVVASIPLSRPTELPYGVFRVGQVRVHPHDRAYHIIVNAHDWLAAELEAGR